MPRRREQAPVLPSRSLVASSTRYPGKVPRMFVQGQGWQRDCYRHYAICGEARFAARFFGHAVSRAVLSVAMPGDDGKPTASGAPAQAVLAGLFSGKDGQVEMLEALGTHLSIAGECYLIGRALRHPDGTESDLWEIVSVLEIRVTGDRWQIDYGNGSPPIDLTEDDVVLRVWTPSPGNKVEADSPFRSLLPILGEIEYLTRHIFAQITSRLAGAGILFVSQNMTFDAPPDQADVATEAVGDLDPFLRVLADAMMAPIQNPESPAALVPIIVKVPDDTVDKAHLMQFWSTLDDNARGMREEAIKRFALGMDLPPEQVLGMSASHGTGGGRTTGVSHWGAWQIEEATIKLHIEPMLDVICNALTMGYLRPLQSGNSVDFVTYDTSSLRLRPDRSKEAMELFDRGVLNPKALIRETGFNESDMPTEEEFRRWLLIKIASGSATPEQVAAAVAALGISLPMAPEQAIAQGDTRASRPPPSLEQHPTRDLPAAALLSASHALVFRALERAGNRLRQYGQRPPGVPAYETHVHVKANGSASRVLEDAWSCAAQVLGDVADVDEVVPVLNSYCENLIAEQTPHTKDRLASWLSLAGVL